MFNKKYINYFFKSTSARVLILFGIIWGIFLFSAGINNDPYWIWMFLLYIGIFILAYIGTWISWKRSHLD